MRLYYLGNIQKLAWSHTHSFLRDVWPDLSSSVEPFHQSAPGQWHERFTPGTCASLQCLICCVFWVALFSLPEKNFTWREEETLGFSFFLFHSGTVSQNSIRAPYLPWCCFYTGLQWCSLFLSPPAKDVD